MPMMAAKQSYHENKRQPGKFIPITTSTRPSCILLDLPAELLVKILAYLPVADLLSVWWTCHTFGDIIAGTTYLQYIIHAYTNGVEDSLPPDFPYSKRLELLRHREQSWSDPRFDLFTEYVTNIPWTYRFSLQDGYLIYESLGTSPKQYGYTDLYSAARNEEVPWVHITIENSRFHRLCKITFAADHNLAIASKFVSLLISFSVPLTEVIANSESAMAILSRNSLPFSNSQLVHFILSHQHILSHFHHPMYITVLLWA
jgi:hypothetical protein